MTGIRGGSSDPPGPSAEILMLNSLSSAFVAACDAIAAVLAGIAALFLVLVTLGIGAEALMRSLNLGLIRGIVDFAEHAMFNMAILGAPWILRKNAHIGVDILVINLRPAGARICAIFADLCGLVLCAVVTVYGWRIFALSFASGEYIIQELIIPEWWLQWQVPLTFALLTVEFARRLGRRLHPQAPQAGES